MRKSINAKLAGEVWRLIEVEQWSAERVATKLGVPLAGVERIITIIRESTDRHVGDYLARPVERWFLDRQAAIEESFTRINDSYLAIGRQLQVMLRMLSRGEVKRWARQTFGWPAEQTEVLLRMATQFDRIERDRLPTRALFLLSNERATPEEVDRICAEATRGVPKSARVKQMLRENRRPPGCSP